MFSGGMRPKMRHKGRRILLFLLCVSLFGCGTMRVGRGGTFPELVVGQRYAIVATNGPGVSGVLLETRGCWIKMDFGNTGYVGWQGVVWVPREQVKLIGVIGE